VATLLHLSDLHLGDGAADEVSGDHKVEVIAQDSRQSGRLRSRRPWVAAQPT
jgi:hypothetical protein